MDVFIVFLYLFLVVYLVAVLEKIEDVFWLAWLIGVLVLVAGLLF